MLAAAVAERCATGISAGKVLRIAAAMGTDRLFRDQAGTICASLDAEAEEFERRPPGSFDTPHLWLGATYAKCRCEGRAASTAVVTAIGCGSKGWRHVPGVGVIDTESYDFWSALLDNVRRRSVRGAPRQFRHPRGPEAGDSGGPPGGCLAALRRAPDARLLAGCRLAKRVSRIVAPVFRLRDAGAVRVAYHITIDMLAGCCSEATRVLEEAEPDALAYLDFS